jgi:hypothetical protein
MLLDFRETNYLAAAERAEWDIEALRHPRSRRAEVASDRR